MAKINATTPHNARYARSCHSKSARVAAGVNAATNGSTKWLNGKKLETAVSQPGMSSPGTMNTPDTNARGRRVAFAIAVAACPDGANAATNSPRAANAATPTKNTAIRIGTVSGYT